MKYYIKKISRGHVYYKAYPKRDGWYGAGDKDIAWKFSKAGAKKIIERYEHERDTIPYSHSEDTIWELEEVKA